MPTRFEKAVIMTTPHAAGISVSARLIRRETINLIGVPNYSIPRVHYAFSMH